METIAEGFYPVFEVDVCWQGWAIDLVQVGAKDVDDLKEHLGDALKGIVTKRQLNELKKDEQGNALSRIHPVKDVYTTKPYKILVEYAYTE